MEGKACDAFCLLYNLFLAVLGFRCCAWAFSSCGEQGLLFVAVHGLSHCSGFSHCGARALGVRASVVAARGLSSCGSRALEHRLSSCGTRACGIFPDQGSNPCPLHWQADSQPLRHRGSPRSNILEKMGGRSDPSHEFRV